MVHQSDLQMLEKQLAADSLQGVTRLFPPLPQEPFHQQTKDPVAACDPVRTWQDCTSPEWQVLNVPPSQQPVLWAQRLKSWFIGPLIKKSLLDSLDVIQYESKVLQLIIFRFYSLVWFSIVYISFAEFHKCCPTSTVCCGASHAELQARVFMLTLLLPNSRTFDSEQY